jgi:hypothetical protein
MGRHSSSALSRRYAGRILRMVLASVASIGIGSAGSALAQVEDTDLTPSGMVAFFMMSGTACPSGWTAPPEVQGRLILGVTDPARVGQQVGSPLADQTPPAHSHTFQTTISLSVYNVALAGGPNSDAAGAQTDNVPSSPPGTTNGGTADPSNLPFIQLVACRKN